MQTTYEFVLPKGYLDRKTGEVYQRGTMRLATAADELEAMKDARVRSLPDYASVIVLSQVIQLNGIAEMNTAIIEGLFSADFNYLQDMYSLINQNEDRKSHAQCPYCGREFDIDINF